MEPEYRASIFIICLVFFVSVLTAIMTSSDLFRDIAADIYTADIGGFQYLPVLLVMILLAIPVGYMIAFPVSSLLPPLLINIRHRRKHPNTSSGVREFFIQRTNAGQKYHHRLLSESEPTQVEGEHQ